MQTRLRRIFCLCLSVGAALGPTRIVAAEAMDAVDRLDVPCHPFPFLMELFDGGVLEVSYDDGLTFHDVLAAGGTFVLGGYNGTINSCCGNPLAGRQAWTGNSTGFIDTTVVSLPGGCLSQFIVRWRMGSDGSVSGEGWRIDNVEIAQCNPPPVRRRPDPRPRPTPHPRPSP